MEDKIFITSQGQIERFDVEYFQGGIGKINFKSFELLGKISEKIQSGSTPSGGKFEDKGILYLKSANFDLYKIQKSQFINNDFHKKINRSKVIKGDILVASVGATIGKVGYYSFTEEANINQNVARVRINDKRFIDKYVAIFLYSDLGQKQLIGNSTVNAQPYINNKKLSNLKIPLLSLEIQNQIVEKIDRALEIKKQKEKEAKQLLESIDDFVLGELGIEYEEVEEKKIFGINLSELGESKRFDVYINSPEKINFKKLIKNYKSLSDLEINFRNGAPFSSKDFGKGKIPLIRIRDIKRNYIDVRNAEKIEKNNYIYSIPTEGEIVVGMDGDEFRASIYENKYGNISINQRITIIGKSKDINSYYLQYILNSSLGIKQFDLCRTIAGVVGHISTSDIKNFKIPLPPLEIQEKIVNEVKSRIEKANILEKEAREIYESAKKEVEGIILGN